MGSLISMYGKKELKMQLEYMQSQLKITNQNLQKNQKKNHELNIDNGELYDEISNLSEKNKELSNKLNRIEEILNNHNAVAEAILESDLNCKWMDDTKQKEYLLSILEFLQIACSQTNVEEHSILT